MISIKEESLEGLMYAIVWDALWAVEYHEKGLKTVKHLEPLFAQLLELVEKAGIEIDMDQDGPDDDDEIETLEDLVLHVRNDILTDHHSQELEKATKRLGLCRFFCAELSIDFLALESKAHEELKDKEPA